MMDKMTEPMNRILLVDDDAVTNMMHRRVIERSGRVTTIDVATDGQEALDLLHADLAHGRPLTELIFLDINMPGMGGFEFLEHYANLDIDPDAQLVLVMLSTSRLESDYVRAQADPNVHSFCDKPLRVEKLLELVEEFQLRVDRDRQVG
jgi:CheY-like chemotaxis protein